MSKAEDKPVYLRDGKQWVLVNGPITLPEIIEGQAKDWIRRYGPGWWLMQVERHKPNHTKGRKRRYYYVLNPKKRPLITPAHGSRTL